MNTYEALLNVLKLPEVLTAANKPHIEIRCFMLHSRCCFSLIATLDVIARAIRHNEITEAQHPSVELFIYLFKMEYLQWDMANKDWMFEQSPVLVQRINRFLNAYVRETKTNGFMKKLSNMRRREKRNRESLLDYCDSLFDVYSRLLVVRIDFHYQPEFYEELTLQQVIEDREAFLDSVKRNFTWLVGLSWKLEYEPQRKFHYHFVFFFDGNKTRQDISLGSGLGDCWVRTTGSAGSYHNCNSVDKKYPERYLGMIHYSDAVKREALRNVIYLTKNDENILAILCNGRTRIFGKMEIPHKRSTAGRPRIARLIKNTFS